jgi:hypothetical protein
MHADIMAPHRQKCSPQLRLIEDHPNHQHVVELHTPRARASRIGQSSQPPAMVHARPTPLPSFPNSDPRPDPSPETLSLSRSTVHQLEVSVINCVGFAAIFGNPRSSKRKAISAQKWHPSPSQTMPARGVCWVHDHRAAAATTQIKPDRHVTHVPIFVCRRGTT